MASTGLPWLWVIETLADLKEAGPSLLKALVSRVPDFMSDSSASVRERVALRYLEECLNFGSTNAASPSTALALGSGGGIDVSRSSEEVLCLHLKKVKTLGNLEMGGAELYRHDLEQFVLQKRATSPKSSLDLLKDSFLEGFRAASPLKEHNVLARVNQVDYLYPKNDSEYENLKKLKLDTNDGEIHSLKQISAAPALESGNAALQEDPSVSGQQLLEHDDSNGDRRNHLQKGIVSNSTDGNDVELLKQSSMPLLPVTENKSHRHAPPSGSKKNVHPPFCRNSYSHRDLSVIPETPSEGDGYNDASSDFYPNDEICSAEKDRLLSSQVPANHQSMTEDWTGQGTCIKCDKGGQLLICCSSSCSIAVHKSCLGSIVSFKETERFYCPFCLYTQAATAYRKARKKVSQACKALSNFVGKDSVLGNQMKLPPVRDLGEPSLDVNVIHRHKIHSNQQQREITKTTEQHQQAEPAIVCNNGNSSSRAAEMHVRCDGSLNAGEIDHDKTINNHQGISQGQHQQETDAAIILKDEKLPSREIVKSPIGENVDIPLIKEDSELGNSRQCMGVLEDQQLAEPHMATNSGNIACEEVDTTRIRETYDVSQAKGKSKIDLADNCLHIQKLKHQDRAAVTDHGIDNKPYQEAVTSLISERHAKRRKESAIHQIRNPQGTVENKNTENPSFCTNSKSQIRTKRYSNPMFPRKRRAKLHWTPEEEEALKGAVLKFSVKHDGSIPWTKILEFGCHIFHKTREPDDLRVKWRSISKRAQKQDNDQA